MKNTVVPVAVALLVLLGAKGGNALPLIGAGDLTLGGVTYTIADRSRDSTLDSEIVERSGLQGYISATGPIEYTGMYLGTITSANDSEDDLNKLISYFLDLDEGGTFLFDKIDYDDADNLTRDHFEVTYDPLDADDEGPYSGTWATTNTPPSLVSFYSIKGSNEFALYYVDPADDFGYWSTVHLLNNGGQQPAISHIQVSLTDTAPIPEPATMILFGTGLAGLAGIMRKKRNG